MSGEEVPKIPSIELSQNRFLLTSGPKETHAEAKEAILKKMKEDSTLLSYLPFVLETLDSSTKIFVGLTGG